MLFINLANKLFSSAEITTKRKLGSLSKLFSWEHGVGHGTVMYILLPFNLLRIK